MEFSLHRGDTEERFTGDGARYRVDHKGMLHVTTADGKQRTYSPNGWDYVEEAAPTGPQVIGL